MDIDLKVMTSLEHDTDESTTKVEPLEETDLEDKRVENQEHKESQKEEKQEEEDRFELMASQLKVKLQSPGESNQGDEEEDGFKTPTSEEHKIPVMLECPPAPRRPRPSFSYSYLLSRSQLGDQVAPIFSVDFGSSISPNLDLLRESREQNKRLRKGDDSQ